MNESKSAPPEAFGVTQVRRQRLVARSSGTGTNSVNTCDAYHHNEFGEMYCVAMGVLPEQVQDIWNEYQKNIQTSEEGTS